MILYYVTLDVDHILRVVHSGKQGYNATSIAKKLSVKWRLIPENMDLDQLYSDDCRSWAAILLMFFHVDIVTKSKTQAEISKSEKFWTLYISVGITMIFCVEQPGADPGFVRSEAPTIFQTLFKKKNTKLWIQNYILTYLLHGAESFLRS